MEIINGKKIAEKKKKEIVKDVCGIIKKGGRRPSLAVILLGEREDSKLYVSLKEKTAKEVGIDTSLYLIDENENEESVIEVIDFLNKDDDIDGILVQLPLPKKFNTDKILQRIKKEKDVDGFNLDKEKKLYSPVLLAVKQILDSIKVDISGKKAFLFYNSEIFGKEMKSFLKKQEIKLNSISSKDLISLAEDKKKFLDLKEKVKKNDILITALGKANFIDQSFLRDDMIVIDIGITKMGKKVCGDVDFSASKKISGNITPVPGGVGPITVVCLLKNVVQAYFDNKA
jgi:methylenetetrahydrofolate dehydrogenase (NADP+) / methenyltetrahydrofolate cyclohydrolase